METALEQIEDECGIGSNRNEMLSSFSANVDTSFLVAAPNTSRLYQFQNIFRKHERVAANRYEISQNLLTLAG